MFVQTKISLCFVFLFNNKGYVKAYPFVVRWLRTHMNYTNSFYRDNYSYFSLFLHECCAFSIYFTIFAMEKSTPNVCTCNYYT